jgi:hypothetical protein
MGAPLVFAENLFSTVQFPSHVLAANETATGHEAFRVADGRRSSLDYWTPTTANNEATLKVTCDRVRAANCLFFDRGHNLAGKTVHLEHSQDDFTTYASAFSGALPTATAPGALTDSLGVRTEEGAWGYRFSLRAAKYWRIRIPAMGTGLAPKLVGVWLGTVLDLAGLTLPVAPGSHRLVAPVHRSDVGWMARGRAVQQRDGVLTVRFTTLFDDELARYHLEGHYGAGRPMWVIHDSDEADRAFLAIRPEGSVIGTRRDARYFFPQAEIPYEEHEPVAA